jgi:hypothetical protein
MLTAAKVDANQPLIVAAMRSKGAYVHVCSQLKNAWDVIVFFMGRIFIMEIKNPEYITKSKPLEASLTEGERKTREYIERTGNIYHIVTTPEQALQIIGAV